MQTIENKDYRDDLLEILKSSYSNFFQAVANFNAPVAKDPINIEDLDSFPLMSWVQLNSKIKVRKRNKRFKDHLCFDTKMDKGANFGEHFHEDTIESTEVIYGEMLDTSTDTVYKDGDVAHYEKGEKHTPIATKDTLLHVLFKP